MQDGVCTVVCKGETLAHFPVEDPVHATATTTSQGTPAVVLRWGNFTEDETPTILLPDLDLLQLEGDFSQVTLTDALPDTFAAQTLPAFSSGGLEISCPGPVTVDGEINTFYLTSPLSQVTLADSLDALVYSYHDIPLQGGRRL